MSNGEKVLDFPRVEVTSEENARRVMVEATRLASLAPGEWRLWIDRSAERLRIPRATLQDLIVAIIKNSEKMARDAETAARRQELAVRREQERKQREQKREQERIDKRTEYKKRESIREPDQFAERAAEDQARRTSKTTRRGRCRHSRPFHSICWHAKLGCINRFMECRTLARSGRDSEAASADQR